MDTKNQGQIRTVDPELLAASVAAFRAPQPLAAPMAAAAAPAPAPVLRTLHVSQQYFSSQAAAKASVGLGVFSGGVDASESSFAIRYEALMEGDPQPIELDGVAWEKVNAVGVILDLSVVQSSANVHFDIFSVAAAVKLGFAKAQYSTQILPADPTVLAAMAPSSGDWDLDNYQQVIDGIGRVKNVIADSGAALTPVTYFRPSRVIPSVDGDLVLSQTVALAMWNIAKSKYVETATSDAVDNKLDPTIVHLVYQALWPEVQDHVDPPDDVIKSARQWLADNFSG